MTSDLSVYERNARLLVTSLREMGYHVVEPGGPSTSSPAAWSPTTWPSVNGPSSSTCSWFPAPASVPPGHVRIAYCVQTEMIERSLSKFKALAESYQ